FFTSLSFLILSSTPKLSPLSLHDALPIYVALKSAWTVVTHYRWRTPLRILQIIIREGWGVLFQKLGNIVVTRFYPVWIDRYDTLDRKSTRLNSSHEWISYAVFCLKKKKKK